MRKQIKLVAVLSTAALLAIGAFMISFVATGQAEEGGTWVYYNRGGERAIDQWKRSGDNWYWLNDDGRMTIDQLIEDGDNYYYVDINGIMAANQWVVIDDEDAGRDNEPDHYWYYFQANGKALKNGDNVKVALKTINDKRYVFDDEGKVLYGWVSKDNAECVDDTDGDGFKEGTYYFDGEDDGVMAIGWLQMDITYDEAINDNETAPVFNDDEDQSRWFYFQSNSKKVQTKDGGPQRSKTINDKKYEPDQYGAMTAEWSLDVDAASKSGIRDGYSTSVIDSVSAKHAEQWRYFNSVEGSFRVSKGWFKVVAVEYLNYDKYNDDEDAWYYADGNDNLYASEFKTIRDKKYVFRNDGRMVDRLKFINGTGSGLGVVADDGDTYPFDDGGRFDENAPKLNKFGYKRYYFGDGNDGAMRINKATVSIDGDSLSLYFERSGGNKGAGRTGEKDDKFHQFGKLLRARSGEKYQVVKTIDDADSLGYAKLNDADDFVKGLGSNVTSAEVTEENISKLGLNKKIDDIKELYIINDGKGMDTDKYFLVNTSGKVIDSKSKNKDGNDFQYAVAKGGKTIGIYVED